MALRVRCWSTTVRAEAVVVKAAPASKALITKAILVDLVMMFLQSKVKKFAKK
jgi:hypothetical protein